MAVCSAVSGLFYVFFLVQHNSSELLVASNVL
jgi:hypothetical protein